MREIAGGRSSETVMIEDYAEHGHKAQHVQGLNA
jgi:hypothetical protein